MNHTLSTRQWQTLQELFVRAESLDEVAVAALVDQARADDAVVGESLAAMLAAHQRWQSRTSDALESLAETTQVSAVGTRLGAYRLVSEIGRGGMGVVYLGERVDGQVQQHVAIKVLHTHNLDDNTRARFQREREILAEFEHPGIARLLDAGVSAAGEPYFVMEYLRGLGFTEHCDQHHLGIRARLQLFLQVCDAVQYAHGKLILHRDIKPSNVLVDGAGTPRLIDFGIAKPLHGPDGGNIDETLLAQRFFSPVNAAPEQVRGGSVAVTCDVYQLGTLLYELLCGQPLFDLRGKTAKQIEELICESQPCSPSESAARGDTTIARARRFASSDALSRALRGDLDAITQKAVRKDPRSRYLSAAELGDDVRRYLGNLPVHGRRGTTWYRLTRFSQRHWRSIGVAAIAVLGLVLFTGVLISQREKTASERDNTVAEIKSAGAVTDFLVDVFRNAGPSDNGKLQTPIGAVLGKGAELMEQRTDVDPRTRAHLLSVLADISISSGDFDAAEKQILHAVRLVEDAPGIEPLLLADYYQQAAYAVGLREKNEAAAELARRAFALYDAAGAGMARSWLARLSMLRGEKAIDETTACEGIETLLANLRQTPDAPVRAVAMVLNDAARCRLATATGVARNVEELSAYIDVVSKTLGPETPAVFQLKQTLSRVYVQQRRFDEATTLLLGIEWAQNRIHGRESLAVAYTYLALGDALYHRDNSDGRAESYYEQSRAILARSVDSRSGPAMAATVFGLARVHDIGHHDETEVARTLYLIALKMGRAAIGPRSRDVGMMSANYGVLLLRSNAIARAEPLLRDAAAVLPASEPDGVRARLALARIHAGRNENAQAAALVRQAESGIAEVVRDDPRFAPEIQQLRASIEAAGSPPAR